MRRLLTSTLLVLALSTAAAGAQEFSSLEERMSAREFREAGLDKLTPEELARLNAWLQGQVRPAAAPATPAEDRRGFLSGSDDDDTVIVSSIAGPFRGWRTKGERFTLTNGQIWEVTDAPTKFVVNVADPVVRIEPGAFSAWYLKIDGYNARAKVKRIR